jgi:hypothetical protein
MHIYFSECGSAILHGPNSVTLLFTYCTQKFIESILLNSMYNNYKSVEFSSKLTK